MKILLLSPHTDDIELGAGGFLIKLPEENNDIRWVVFSMCASGDCWGSVPMLWYAL